MTITFTSNYFKDALPLFRKDLEEQGVTLKLKRAHNLLSITLVDKNWSQLSPALPKDISIDADSVRRMEQWLYKHHKPLSYSQCEVILKNIIEKNDTNLDEDNEIHTLSTNPGWEYIDDLNWLKKEVAPLYNGTDSYGNVDSAIILVNPKEKYIDTQGYTNPGDPDQVYGLVYAFEIPSDISGRALVEVLEHDKFIVLTQAIIKNWKEDWNGNDWVGLLDVDTKELLEDFYYWISVLDPDIGDVFDAELFFTEIVYAYDKDGNELELDNEDDEFIYKYVIDEKFQITIETNIKDLAKEILAAEGNSIEILGLEPYLEYYYKIVCKNYIRDQEVG